MTIEPMIATGTRNYLGTADGWTVVTANGANSAHEEHTIVVTRRRADRPHGGVIDGLANLDAVRSATASRTEGGWRALDLRAWDGIDARAAARSRARLLRRVVPRRAAGVGLGGG